MAPAAPGGELQAAVERLRLTLEEGGASRGTTAAMANLAEAIQGLVTHMRTEQQMIRDWADGQGEQNREIKKLLERIARAAREELSEDRWPSPVRAATKPDSTTGRASSTRCRRWCSAIVFLLSVFLVVQFFLSQEVTGKDKALERAQRQDRAAHRPAVAGKTRQAQSRRPAGAAARGAGLGRSRARPRQGPL